MPPEVKYVDNDRPTKADTAFIPVLPAHIAARKKHLLPIHNQEFRVHDAEGSEEQALDVQVETAELFWCRETKFRCPSIEMVGMTFWRRGVKGFLEEGTGRETQVDGDPRVIVAREGLLGEVAQACGEG